MTDSTTKYLFFTGKGWCRQTPSLCNSCKMVDSGKVVAWRPCNRAEDVLDDGAQKNY
jgi:hypothetical protein